MAERAELVRTEAGPENGGAIATRTELSVEEIEAQVAKIADVMERVMLHDVHYGTIPGTDKPTLYKPGAEKLCLTFRLDPQYQRDEVREEGGHYTVTLTCTLWHIDSGKRIGSALGMCSTHEAKYAYRKAQRRCPVCNAEAVIRGRKEYGGGWLCWRKRGGCGESFPEDDAEITAQDVGERIPNPDLADAWNTVLKIGTKRALVAAVLNATAASDIFTQDVEDTVASPDDDDTDASAAPAPAAGQSGRVPGMDVMQAIRERFPHQVGDVVRAVREHLDVTSIPRLTDEQAQEAYELLDAMETGPADA